MNSVILICALGLAHAQCSVDTADVVVQGPEVTNLVTCGLHGQAYLAETALASYLDDQHYLTIACRSRPRQPAAGDAARILAQNVYSAQ